MLANKLKLVKVESIRSTTMIDLSHYSLNPYRAGPPIKDEKMLFGRDHIFSQVHTHLVGEHPNHPIVIYGQRRMGKTSVLFQMERRLNAIEGQDRYVAVLLDLQGFKLRGEDHFWYELADTIHWEVSRDHLLPELDEAMFETDALLAFRNSFLPMMQAALGSRRLVLMFDESMRLEQVVGEERLPKSIFHDLGALMHCERQISFIYSLATLVSNLRPEYRAMFREALTLHVTFLNDQAAHGLVTEPVAKFYKFDEDAEEYLLALTAHHPYFTQMLCLTLFYKWEQQHFRRATCPDILAVVDQATNSALLNIHYLWQEATIAEKLVLVAMAEMEANRVSVPALDRHLKRAGIYLGPSHIRSALRGLHQREIIDSSTPPRINMGMFRDWLSGAKDLWFVSQEFRDYLPPVPLNTKQEEPEIEPARQKALTRPWVRTFKDQVYFASLA